MPGAARDSARAAFASAFTGTTARSRSTARITVAATFSGGYRRRRSARTPASRHRSATSSETPTNRIERAMGVLVNPGQITLTPMSYPASSARRHSLSINTAALVVEYAGCDRLGVNAAADAMFTR
jgi:hypothetical protein